MHKLFGLLTLLVSTLLITGCSDPVTEKPAAATNGEPARTYEWKMVTTWPKNFPGLGTSANELAEAIEAMSGGRLKIKVYGAGELVGPFESFDAVSRGTAEMGHSGAYYWKGKVEAAQFFSSVPFGLTAQEMNGWLYFGGGLELWRELYAPFGIIPFPAGNTGTQMGGWFNKEINSVADIKGLKIRMPGLGGEVLTRAGATTINLPGGEIFTALQSGAIDATEWVGPYNDLAFGLHKAARYYYYPGWHEPGSTIELLVNRDAYNALPADLQEIITQAATQANLRMLAEFTARNSAALATLINEHGVELRAFPPAVLEELQQHSQAVFQELVDRDPASAKVFESFSKYRQQVMEWHAISEQAIMATRPIPNSAD
ncbi:MAG: ABC transporter substrate-binding protein [Gammaproteobacteria bacterium]|nr:MAG: ABC transporter substrate-binding protein [Gammaproteobacteria bacterium]RLA15695.1 MAG: ABC transporter substrate-binding protein [Gammaproteobacteria bacterium]